MALYYDTACCIAAIELNIPFVACVPFGLQWCKWTKPHQERYFDLLSKATRVVYVDELDKYRVNGVSDGLYHPAKLHKRNEYIIDNVDHVLAYYDNSGSGGTANAIRYANKLKLPITNIYEVVNK